MMAWLRRAFSQRPTDKPAPLDKGGATVSYSLGAVETSAYGVVMPDGTIVRCAGEPPIAKGGNWWPPTQQGG